MKRFSRVFTQAALLRGDRGGAATLTLVGFLVLAVPVVLASVQLANTLIRVSGAYDRLLIRHYTAGAGAEKAFWQILNDPTFGDNLTPVDPCSETTLDINGETVIVTVCKTFTATNLQGQGIIVTKTVTPGTAPVDVETTFTYTLTLRNEGTGAANIKQIYDYLPPRFTYVAGSTTGLTTGNPSMNDSTPITCGDKPYQLFWNVESDGVTIEPDQQATLTFQARATVPDGTYYNQASVRYVPWWTSNNTPIDVFTPFTAEVVVGSGTPYCGYDLNVRVTKEVEPPVGVPGVETEFTYTILVENLSAGTRYVCQIEDVLPPTFTYVVGSAGEYGANISPAEPDLDWNSGSGRWTLTWQEGTGNNLDPLISMDAGETRTQVFRARTVPEPGVDYFNEVAAVWSKQLVGGHCKTGSGDGGASSWGGSIEGGASDPSAVDIFVLYDITSVASDGSIQSRVQFYEANGELKVLSWQQY